MVRRIITDKLIMWDIRGCVMRAVCSIVSSEHIRRWIHSREVVSRLLVKEVQAVGQKPGSQWFSCGLP
jgi:hypothetical protein